jgi:hypothetical protein
MLFGWQPPCVAPRVVQRVEQPRRAYLMAAHGVGGTVGEREVDRVDEQKAMCKIATVAPKPCSVSVTDANGSRQSVEVLADSLYEGAALGLKLLRDADWVDTLGSMTHLQLQVRAPTVVHDVTIQQLERWLEGTSMSPHDAIRKARIKALLASVR